MNNKGITLIEIIASLAILAIVSAIVVPNIFNMLKENKAKLYENQIDIIEDASRNWAADYIAELPTVQDEHIDVTMEELQNGGYLDENYESAKTGEAFPLTSFVRITCTFANEYNYSYDYTFYLEA